jgi:hypothetical protein
VSPENGEAKTFHQQQQREAKEERFRKVVLANPEMTTTDLAERFGIRSHEVGRWCDRLKLPRPPVNEGVTRIARPDYDRKRRKGGGR